MLCFIKKIAMQWEIMLKRRGVSVKRTGCVEQLVWTILRSCVFWNSAQGLALNKVFINYCYRIVTFVVLVQDCILCSTSRVLERRLSVFKGFITSTEAFAWCGGCFRNGSLSERGKIVCECWSSRMFFKAIRLCIISADVMRAINLIMSTLAVKWF